MTKIRSNLKNTKIVRILSQEKFRNDKIDVASQNPYGNTSRVKLEKNFDQILNP